MSGSPILVDSSWYIHHLRRPKGRLALVNGLLEMATHRILATCGVIQCEVRRGLTDEVWRAKIQRQWEIMSYVPTDNSLWDEAAETLYDLDRKGIVLNLPDVLIACCARRIGAVVLTYDKHFELIPGIRATDRIY